MAMPERKLSRPYFAAQAVMQEAAERIEQDLGVSRLTEELQGLPEQIHQAQEDLQVTKQAVAQAKQEVEVAEAVLIATISDEKDPRTGKAAFSNETARKAELAKRKMSDQAYIEAANNLAGAETDQETAQFDLDLLNNRFAALRAVSRLTASRINLIGGAY